MINIKSPGPDNDAGELLNFYIQRGKRRINLDPVDGPFVFHTLCELLDGTVITAHEKLPTIAGAGAVRQARVGVKPHCMATGTSLFYTNGSNCRIRNVVLDYNMVNGYRESSTLIRHGYFEGTPNRLDNNKYEDLTIIDSYSGPTFRDFEDPEQVIDSWAIVFSHAHEAGVTNHTVRNCHDLARGAVLVSGGSGPGIDGLLIENNYCTFGNPEGITLVSRHGVAGVQDVPGDTATLQNITIRNNTIWDFSGLGIHVGQDTSIFALEVNLRNILVEKNWVTINAFRENNFPNCVTFKAGIAATSVMENVIVRNNILDVSRAHPTSTPKWITGSAPSASPLAEVRHYDNTVLGSGGYTFNNITVYTEALEVP